MNQTYQQHATALGTNVLLTLVTNKPSKSVDQIFKQLWDHVYSFQGRFSRFLPDSELSQLNLHAGVPTKVSDELGQFLAASLSMSRRTNGLFNPFVLPALQRVGYTHSFVDTALSGPDFSNRRVADWDKLKILHSNIVTMPSDAALDSGGCGKGYVLDQLVQLAEEYDIADYWLSLGGDIATRGNTQQGDPWRVDIVDAQQPNITRAHVTQKNKRMFVATSGILKRSGMHEGKAWHHIINPATGRPAKTDILSATVVGKSGIEADVFASCLVAGGISHFKKLAKQLGVKNALLQTTNIQKPFVHIGSRVEISA